MSEDKVKLLIAPFNSVVNSPLDIENEINDFCKNHMIENISTTYDGCNIIFTIWYLNDRDSELEDNNLKNMDNGCVLLHSYKKNNNNNRIRR